MEEPIKKTKYSDDFFAPLSIPFQQHDSIMRTGICALLSLVPILNLVYLTGYKHQMMVAVAHEDEIPPDPMNISAIAISGLILTILNVIFYLIPILAMFLLGFSPLEYLLAIGDVFRGSLSVFDWVLGMIGRFAILVFWQIAFGPIFMSAQMHYAKRGSILVFFNFIHHVLYVLRHGFFFLRVEVFSWLFWFVAIVIEGIVAPTGIGLILWPPMVAAVYVISTGYEYGVKAQSITP